MRRFRRGRLALLLIVSVALVLVMLFPVAPPQEDAPIMQPDSLDLTGFSAENPHEKLQLLFIHHSCGGQWLAPWGEDRGEHCIYEAAVNGGGLRELLTAAGYEVHEASYGSLVGDRTNIFDWPPKFRDQMDKVLGCDRQDTFYEDSRRNRVVMFKSCFPNNRFITDGQRPGNAEGPQLTVANAKAAYRQLLPEFESRPQTLFVAVTAPPLALGSTPLYKLIARRLLGRPDVRASGKYARKFNNWLKDPKTGWLSEYPGKNVAVFDLYDILTDYGVSNFLEYPTGRHGNDSHPSAEGNRKAAEAFVPFLNRAVRRARLAR